MSDHLLLFPRTPLTVAMCAAMREAGDFSDLPILADLLQDEGFADLSFLARLRHSTGGRHGQRLCAIVYSRESAEAVGWMDAFAERCDFDCAAPDDGWGGNPRLGYAGVLDAAERYLDGGEMTVERSGTIIWQNVLDEEEEAFWTRYEHITGRKVPDKTVNFFSCSC
jgi:hypothetical protein